MKIVETDNILLKTMYNIALNDSNSGCVNWVTNVKKILNAYGFSYVFDQINYIDKNIFLTEFKNRILDVVKQEWFANLENSSLLYFYKNVKSTFEYEKYLDILPKGFRFYFCKLRMSGLPLRIQTGRFNRNLIPRNERYCLCCNNLDIEDEYHFICICSFYSELRKKYIKDIYVKRPSVYKFIKLLNSCDKTELIQLSLFIKNALALRNSVLTVER
jgi:hypothetical protein